MATSTQAGGNWSITMLEAIETATGTELPSNIISVNTPFQLRATFKGSGSLWNAMVAAKVPYEVRFYAEGLGFTAVERDLAKATGNLVAGDNQATITVVGGLPEGVYRIACLVRVSPGSGVNGFSDDLIVEAA